MNGRALAIALLLPVTAQAGIYTHVEAATGMTIISNVAPARTTALVSVAGKSAAPATATPADFPRVSAQRQHELDGGRRAILEAELANEHSALHSATAARAGAATLHRHQANIAALQRELRAIK